MFRIKIKNSIKNDSRLKKQNSDKTYLKASKKWLKENFNGYSNTNWHLLYSSINNNKSLEYIPEELYFAYIEPALNNIQLRAAYTDKNAANIFFDKKNLPVTIFKIINGSFYNDKNEIIDKETIHSKIDSIKDRIVLKPAIYSGGGKNVLVEYGSEISKQLVKNPIYQTTNFIAQLFVEQHIELKKLNPTSLNTLRIMTARIKNEIVVLSVYLRIGRKNKYIDNGMAGGLFCGVTADGRLMKSGYDKNLKTYLEHPDSKITYENFKVPGFLEACDFCKVNHTRFPYFTLISWDIGVGTSCEPIFIELNLGMQGIIGHQIINGPLFGAHTQYFINLYHKLSS